MIRHATDGICHCIHYHRTNNSVRSSHRQHQDMGLSRVASITCNSHVYGACSRLCAHLTLRTKQVKLQCFTNEIHVSSSWMLTPASEDPGGVLSKGAKMPCMSCATAIAMPAVHLILFGRGLLGLPGLASNVEDVNNTGLLTGVPDGSHRSCHGHEHKALFKFSRLNNGYLSLLIQFLKLSQK